MRSTTMRCAAIAAALAAAGTAAAAGPLFPVRKDGKWGYIDRAGALVIAPRFDRAERFSEGLAAVEADGKRGYVDETGKLALVPEQGPAGAVHRRFSGGLAAVKAGGAIGFIDRAGKLVIPARFTSADDFSEGYAFACDQDGCGYIDRSGHAAVGGGILAGRPFRNGVAGLALRGGRHGAKRYVLHDAKRGRLVGDYDDVGPFSEGLIPVRFEGRWGYVDAGGRPVIRPRFAGAGAFSEGLAPVHPQVWSCGYADKKGALAIPARFRLCFGFADGRARVELLGTDPKVQQPAFIDRTGAVVIDGTKAKPPFQSAEDFSGGLAAVESASPSGAPRLGYVDASGRYVWPPTE
jgi:WG repeat protein